MTQDVRLPDAKMLDLAALAVAAGEVIMDIYEKGVEAELKSDNTPVTQADLAAEKVILAGLQKLDPDTPVIAEEAVAAGAKPQRSARFYLVDPLDGTREFISRNGEFTVNIGLIENGVPVCGVVFAPAVGRLFCGAAGAGAFEARFCVGDDLAAACWRRLETPEMPSANIKAVASRSHRDEQTENWLAQNNIAETVAAGSSLKFCLLASGEAHLYPRFGRTMEWDTAAGHAVLAAAGGSVSVADGSPLGYGKQERGFDNPAFFASVS